MFKAIDKIRRAFLWKGTDAVQGGKGGKCLVNWQTVCQPKANGGLGILDLQVMNSAVNTPWAWSLRAEEKKAWACLVSPTDAKAGVFLTLRQE